MARWSDGSRVQTLIFDASLFDGREAKTWARDHGFKASKLDRTEHTIRLRQESPSHFRKETFRTISMTTGVQAIIAVPKKAHNPGSESISRRTRKKSRPLTWKDPLGWLVDKLGES